MDNHKEHGFHLAMAAALGVLAVRVAKMASPESPIRLVTEFGQQAFDTSTQLQIPALQSQTPRQ
jgi:hypothetical protein